MSPDALYGFGSPRHFLDSNDFEGMSFSILGYLNFQEGFAYIDDTLLLNFISKSVLTYIKHDRVKGDSLVTLEINIDYIRVDSSLSLDVIKSMHALSSENTKIDVSISLNRSEKNYLVSTNIVEVMRSLSKEGEDYFYLVFSPDMASLHFSIASVYKPVSHEWSIEYDEWSI